MSVIRNSDKPPKKFRSWMEYWQHLKENHLTNELVVRSVCNDDEWSPMERRLVDSVTVLEYSFDLSYIKQMCFDEIESRQPLDWDEEILSQAYYCGELINNQFQCKKLGDWLKLTAHKERERIINERRR